MRVVRVAALIGLMFTITACSTTRSARRDMESRWVGRSADDFFFANGVARSKQGLANGGTIYIWDKATRTSSGSKPTFCIAVISTDASGKIKRIQPNADAVGKWKISRCSELFG